MNKRTVFGVGINDADYKVSSVADGKVVLCPFYTTWKNMLKRCYCEAYKQNRPSYDGCSVADEWHYFMTFRSWMIQQDWEGKQLDKDLLIKGNKLYSPTACMFVTDEVNKFLPDCSSARGDYPVGVYLDTKAGRFKAQCRKLGKGYQHLGLFDCPDVANQAYWTYKKTLAAELAARQVNIKVGEVLINYFKDVA